MQQLYCHDRLSLLVKNRLKENEASTIQQSSSIYFTTDDETLQQNTHDNLVVRAARLWFDATGQPAVDAHIHLIKVLPMQAGMGGGSSDAATTLLALNNNTHTPTLEHAQLVQLAQQLGADVAFFLTNANLAAGVGRGDVMTPLPNNIPPWPMLIVQPKDITISTPDAYRWWAEFAMTQPTESKEDFITRTKAHRQLMAVLLNQAASPDIAQWEALIHNDFEAVVFKRFDVFNEIIDGMHQLGIRRPYLSGSGSAVAGILPLSYFPSYTDPQPESNNLLTFLNKPEPLPFPSVLIDKITTHFPSSRFNVITTFSK
jgi:4-diphosphocytidyl-2-C-methyl-D-erythritol kinase